MRFKKHLSIEQKDSFAHKIMELGNLTFVGLVVSQLIPGTLPISNTALVVGLVSVPITYLGAYILMKIKGE